MIERPRVLDILADLPGDAAEQALLDGLLLVDAELQTDIVGILLERNREGGYEGLIAVYDRLAADAQNQVLTHISRLYSALRAGIKSSAGQTRQNALEIVGRSGNPPLAYLAGQAMRDGSPAVRAEAAGTILKLTDQHCRNHEEIREALCGVIEREPGLVRIASHTIRLLRDEREYLLETLRDALKCYESHLRLEALECAMRMAHELEEELFGRHMATRGKLLHAISELLTSKLDTGFVPVVYLSLPHPELRRRVLQMIESCRDSDFFAEFIRWHWLCADPVIGKSLSSIHRCAWLDGGFETVFNLPHDVAPLLPSWTMRLGLPSAQKVALMRDCLILDNPDAHRAAVWALAGYDSPDSTAELERLRDHEDAAVRRIVSCELERRARVHRCQRRRASDGRPSGWEDLLDSAGLTESFEAFWQHFDRIPENLGHTEGRHAPSFVPDFLPHVQEKLHAQRAADRLRALQLLSALGLSHEFSSAFFSAGNDSSARIRAVAMGALGGIGGETSRRILERALNDEDAAVQAAAIRAVEQMELKHRGRLVGPKLESDHAEVRAAAVRCLLRLQRPEAATALVSMLNDVRADHRCAALWLADQLRLHTLGPRIANMAQCDPDRRIARLALYVARRLRRDEPDASRHEPTRLEHSEAAL